VYDQYDEWRRRGASRRPRGSSQRASQQGNTPPLAGYAGRYHYPPAKASTAASRSPDAPAGATPAGRCAAPAPGARRDVCAFEMRGAPWTRWCRLRRLRARKSCSAGRSAPGDWAREEREDLDGRVSVWSCSSLRFGFWCRRGCLLSALVCWEGWIVCYVVANSDLRRLLVRKYPGS